jgi:hypothetical protein
MAIQVPNRKVAAGGLAGALTVVVISLTRNALGYDMNAEEASAVTTIVSFLVSYFVPNPSEPPSA